MNTHLDDLKNARRDTLREITSLQDQIKSHKARLKELGRLIELIEFENQGDLFYDQSEG